MQMNDMTPITKNVSETPQKEIKPISFLKTEIAFPVPNKIN